MKKFKRKLRKILKDKQLLAIFILFILVCIIGLVVLGIKKTAIIASGLILITVCIRFFGKKKKRKTRETKKEEEKKEKRKNIIIDIILGLILLFIIGCVAFFLLIVSKAPDFNPDNLYSKESSIVYASDGTVIAKLGSELRRTITYDEMPEVLIDAIIATEDSRYFQHNGVDIPRFVKAAVGQLLGNSNAGGGSTITMQISKNAYTSDVSSGIDGIIRKFTDVYLAIFKIEKNYTKEEILEYYVNLPFMGSNSYGVAEAAETYFGKDVSELNLSEAALLAGLFQAPSAYDPYNNPEAAAERRSTVLSLMRRHGYITEEEEKIANAISIESLLCERDYSNEYQSFLDTVVEEIENELNISPYSTPMKIYTTMDLEKQDYLNEVINETFPWVNENVQEGMAVVDVETGGVLALSGGRHITGARGWNRATDTKIQPGSTAKPLFDYSPGMEYLNWSTYTPFIDEAWGYTNGGGIKNWDSSFYGFLTLRESLGLSRNVPALKAFQVTSSMLGNGKVKNYIESLGLTPELENGYMHEAHALGSFDGTSPLEMAAAYAAFANGGYYTEPYTVNKVVLLDTNEEINMKHESVQVMSDSTAYMITYSLIWAVDSGLSNGEKIWGYQIAAKTGTTNLDVSTIQNYGLAWDAVKDYWVAGYTPKISMALWYGYDNLTDGYNTLADNTRKDNLYRTVMQGMLDDDAKTFTVPDSVVKVGVEKGTIPAMLPSEYTPSDKITYEYFKKGTEPTEVSPRYVPLNNVENISSTVENDVVTLTWDEVPMIDYYTDEYMEKYITNGMGDFKDRYINYRKAERDALGAITYDIYLSDSTTETLLTSVTEPTFTFDISKYNEDVTFIIKTSYENDKSTVSTGASHTITNENVNIVSVNLKGEKNITLNIDDTFIDQGITVLKDLTVDDTENAKITIKIVDKDNKEVKTVDTSLENTYTITYTVIYEKSTYSLTRTVSVKDTTSVTPTPSE